MVMVLLKNTKVQMWCGILVAFQPSTLHRLNFSYSLG